MKIMLNICFAAVFAFAFYSFLKASVPHKPSNISVAAQQDVQENVEIARLN